MVVVHKNGSDICLVNMITLCTGEEKLHSLRCVLHGLAGKLEPMIYVFNFRLQNKNDTERAPHNGHNLITKNLEIVPMYKLFVHYVMETYGVFVLMFC